ncbi:MAG: ATP-binding protein [Planctomycetes bacterium]|nr:ATP-binding protein [Planctomycetota bacterium]
MEMKTPISRSMTVASNVSVIEVECRWILTQLEANDFSAADIFAVHLALEEAFINAVKHGNNMDGSKVIKIDYSVEAEKIEICLTDEGVGFAPDDVPDPRDEENLYKTGGRGLFLMRAYMDVVEFNESGNRVRMVKHRSKKAKTKSASS